MFWKKLIIFNASLMIIALQLLSLYLKGKEKAEEQVNN